MRRLIPFLIPILLVLALAGCSTMSTQAPRPSTGLSHDPSAPLFATDAAEIDDLEIARMLDTDIWLPEHIRIGVLHLEHRRQRGRETRLYSRPDEMPRVHTPFVELAASPAVFDVSYVPSLLAPHAPTPGNLRAAAARYQADWLLLYSTRTIVLRKSPVIGTDRSRVWCEAECTVVDVRTGLVTFSSQARASVTAADPDDIWDKDVAIDQAEEEAIAEAMGASANDLARYLDRLAAAVHTG